jgi:DNA-binding NtrC family response regulator
MAQRLSKPQNVNVLITDSPRSPGAPGDAGWAWPQAVSEIFQPRGIKALLANNSSEIVRLVSKNKIHLAILDSVVNDLTGMQALKAIRQHDPLVPCILLAQQPEKRLLAEALALNAFSVLAKPVDINLLAEQIDRLFIKCYSSDMFSGPVANQSVKITIKTVTKKSRADWQNGKEL